MGESTTAVVDHRERVGVPADDAGVAILQSLVGPPTTLAVPAMALLLGFMHGWRNLTEPGPGRVADPMPSASVSSLRPSHLPGIELHCPAGLEQVLGHVCDGVHPLAGGTDLVLWASQRGEPRRLVWTGNVSELQRVDADDDPLRIGAAVTASRIVRDARFRRGAPAVVDGAHKIGSVQLRNQATLVGNLCTASPSGDTIPGLLVHDAKVEIASASSRRHVDVGDFVLGPGETALQPGELVTAVSLSRLGPLEASAYQRFTERNALDLAFAGVAARLAFDPDGRTVRSARLALGAVSPTVIEAAEAAAMLVGQPLNAARLGACADAAAQACSPISDHRASADYRRQLVKVLVGDVVTEAARRLANGRVPT